MTIFLQKEAEAGAIIYALRLDRANGVSRINKSLDAHEVVKDIKGESDWAIEPKILEILEEAMEFDRVESYFVPRSFHVVALQLAKVGIFLSRKVAWAKAFRIGWLC